MKYILPLLILIAAGSIVASKQIESSPTAQALKKPGPDSVSARKELLTGSIEQSKVVDVPDESDSANAAAQAAYEKQVREERKKDMAVIKRLSQRRLPYVLDASSMRYPVHTKYTERDQAITDMIYGPGYGEYSRMVPRTYEFVAYLGTNQGHHLVVYRLANTVSDDIYPASYFLATLTDDGDLVSRKNIANMESPLHIMTATIDTDGHITSQKVTQTWQYKPEQAGYENNKVIKTEVTATEIYKINRDGLISGT